MLWVRRLVALALVVGVVVAAVVGLKAVVAALPGGGSAQEGRSAPPNPTATSTGPPGNCEARDVELVVETPRVEYAPGDYVPVTVTIRRVGGRPCLVDGSDAGRQVVVSSGADRIWSSGDCGGGNPRELLLGEDAADVKTVTWDGERSAPKCPGGLPVTSPGTYTIVATLVGVDGATSKPATIQLRTPVEPAAPGTGTDTAAPADPAAGPVDPAADPATDPAADPADPATPCG